MPERAAPDVFLNVPFDRRYERLFVALLCGVVASRRTPRCVLEIPDGGQGRLDRIFELLASTPVSIHDLSRVSRSRSGPFHVPRFNMPFELGLACALQRLDRGHAFFVLEERPYRLPVSLSDLAGVDPQIHGGTPDGMLRAVTGCLGTSARDPSPARVRRLFDLTFERALELRRQHEAETLFSRPLFRKTVAVATAIAKNLELLA